MSSRALGWVFDNGLTWSKPEWITGLIVADDHRGGGHRHCLMGCSRSAGRELSGFPAPTPIPVARLQS